MSGLLWKLYLTGFYLYAFWYLLGILAVAGWIKPTDIAWFDSTVSKSEKFVREGWEYADKWFGRASLIMFFCICVAVTLFVFSWTVIRQLAELSQ